MGYVKFFDLRLCYVFLAFPPEWWIFHCGFCIPEPFGRKLYAIYPTLLIGILTIFQIWGIDPIYTKGSWNIELFPIEDILSSGHFWVLNANGY